MPKWFTPVLIATTIVMVFSGLAVFKREHPEALQ
jgi:hypothetical protein